MTSKLPLILVATAFSWLTGCQGYLGEVITSGANPTLDRSGAVDAGSDDGNDNNDGNNDGNNDDNNDGSGGGDNGDGPVGDPTNDGCVSDRLDAPAGQNCVCEFDSCDGTSLNCTCDLECYGEDCLIGVDENGNPVTGDGFLGDCDLSCTPEDDLSEEMGCSASNCEIQPNVVDVNPTVAPSAPSTASIEGERAVTDVDVVFVVDNSGSMVDNQMAAACALDAFYEQAGENGGSYQAGVLTTDMLGDREAPGGTYDKYSREYQAPPGMMQAADGCDTIVSCNGVCDASIDTTALCDFDDTGDFVASDAPGSEDELRQAIVQGDNGSNYEGGLEQAFQFFAEQERRGTFDPDTPKEVVVISDEDADGDLAGDYQWLCPFNSVQRNTAGIPNFNPPAAGNTYASCKQDLINFYVYYFTSRNIVVHGLLYTGDCANDSTEASGAIYAAVIAATGGVADSICHCASFDDFFGRVGASTSTLSTEMCFPGSLPDPATIEVVHVETGEVVPPSATNGWTLDADLNCIVMHGSWLERYGSFRIDYVDPDAPPPPPNDPTACLPPGMDPLLDTMVLVCDGVEVPENAANGYLFDPVTDCFTFHGSYTDVVDCYLEYL